MMTISTHDRDILRRLAERQARIAVLPVQQENIKAWQRLNAQDFREPVV